MGYKFSHPHETVFTPKEKIPCVAEGGGGKITIFTLKLALVIYRTLTMREIPPPQQHKMKNNLLSPLPYTKKNGVGCIGRKKGKSHSFLLLLFASLLCPPFLFPPRKSKEES